MDKKTFIFLFLLSLVCMCWRSYPHLLVPRMLPCGEYVNVSYTVFLTKSGGIPTDLLHVPQLEFFLVYVISLFKFNINQIMFFINPLISALTVIPFFFFTRKILNNKQQSLIASIFFAFSEVMFYRTSHYGSAEALGLFLMFIYLNLYLRQRIVSIPFLILIPFAHVLPFIFAIIFTVVDMFFKKKKLTLLCLVVISCLFILNPFISPQTLLSTSFSKLLVNISIEKLFLYSIGDIVASLPYLMGFVCMLFLCLFSFKKSSKIERSILLITLLSFPISLLLYSTDFISPTRLLAYVSLPLFTMAARFLGNNKKLLTKKTCLTVVIILLMIISPLIGGSNNFLWVSDSITQEEIEVISILSAQGLFNVSGSSYWYADFPVRSYISAYWGGIVYNPQNFGCYLYIFLSKRMENCAFFLELHEGGRTVEIRQSVVNIWQNNETGWEDWYYRHGLILQGWILLMDINYIKIYKAIYTCV